MVAPIVYSSNDASAPVLSYGAGTLITVLDACLVNGYGAKGAAGWAKTYSGTNKAAYKMGTGGSARRMFLRVEDANAQYGQIRGYDDMTGVDTGTEPFPTVAQFAGTSNNGLFFCKSFAASGSTPRSWVLIATPTCFYLQIFHNAASANDFPSFTNYGSGFFFGEYISFLGGGFTHHVAIIGASSNGTTTGSQLGTINTWNDMQNMFGHYVCRAYTGAAGSSGMAKFLCVPVTYSNTQNVMGRPAGNTVLYPDPVSGKLYASRVTLSNGGAIVGRLPGLWAAFSAPGNTNDTIAGSGGAAGRTLKVLDLTGDSPSSAGSGNVSGRGFFDTTDLD